MQHHAEADNGWQGPPSDGETIFKVEAQMQGPVFLRLQQQLRWLSGIERLSLEL